MPGIRNGRRSIGPPLFGSGYRVSGAAPSAAYWDPANKGDWVVLSGANKVARGQGAAQSNSVRSVTSHAVGKRYAEIVVDGADMAFGIVNAVSSMQALGVVGEDANSLGYYAGDGTIYENGAGTLYGAVLALGNILGIAVDLDLRRIYFSVNGVWQNSGDPVAGTNYYPFDSAGAMFLCITPGNYLNTSTLRTALADFTYAPPTGYSAWG